MAKTKIRTELLHRTDRAIREASAQGALLSSAVAAHLCITQNDIECLDLINLNGPMTAGKLAETTGLTTGAITGIVDRLAKAGFVRREADPADRRRVIVRVREGSGARIKPLYDSLQRRIGEVLAGYSDKEIALLARFYEKSAEILREETLHLREPASRRGRGRP